MHSLTHAYATDVDAVCCNVQDAGAGRCEASLEK